jgi:hypothetical protein
MSNLRLSAGFHLIGRFLIKRAHRTSGRWTIRLVTDRTGTSLATFNTLDAAREWVRRAA